MASHNNTSPSSENRIKKGHWPVGEFLNLPGDEQSEILIYFASHYNMAEFSPKRSSKAESTIHSVGRIMTFICAAAGAYIIPDTVVNFLNWPSSIVTYWGLFNYVCVGTYVLHAVIQKK